ncbi:MAG: hypothetical protein QOH84_3944 [Kribbellaceae bacterium]|nr:hypothetical protein [Kribbellaceae bacterium]
MPANTTKTAKQEGLPPAHAGAIVDLLNSRAYSSLTDKLDTPESAAAVLRPFGHQGDVVPPGQLELVRSVRADLLDLVTDPDAAPSWARLTSRVSQITYQQEFSAPAQVHLHQVTGDPVVGRIIQAVAALVAEGNWSRLRYCANDECSEVFYDTTRSRTRRWHSYEYCGNRTNVAAHRARHSVPS